MFYWSLGQSKQLWTKNEQSISGVVFRGELSEKWKAELRSEAQLSHTLREFKECHWTSYNKSSWLVWNSRFVFLRSSRIIEVDNVIAERLNAGFSNVTATSPCDMRPAPPRNSKVSPTNSEFGMLYKAWLFPFLESTWSTDNMSLPKSFTIKAAGGKTLEIPSVGYGTWAAGTFSS